MLDAQTEVIVNTHYVVYLDYSLTPALNEFAGTEASASAPSTEQGGMESVQSIR